jgi:hypothetical protein
VRNVVLAAVLLSALEAAAQHDITKVDPAPPGGAIAVPFLDPDRRRLKKYDHVDLAGAKQALGSQLIDGRLPKPLMDLIILDGPVQQRVSLFEGGLAVINMSGGLTLRKKLILPDDAMVSYVKAAPPEALRRVDAAMLVAPEKTRATRFRVYEGNSYVERSFHPSAVLPKTLHDLIAPLQDLLRAMSEDRGVTSTVAGYEPKSGDRLVADDQRIYQVMRVTEPGGIVELKCTHDPTTIYIPKKDLAQYFVGRAE